ncbi:hypothetical protein [Streptomyces iconiensis]|uniref:Integral membrane protein n=1 Tax=Streptomyces iconiensis TaxID=1384038 RepID=A0ABT7AAA6_9ACTN|nr:hypothetical protein [Streptomyces iconiensis]MDJ1138235.1 hypothetical protein [Streptomyces iconiensis]
MTQTPDVRSADPPDGPVRAAQGAGTEAAHTSDSAPGAAPRTASGTAPAKVRRWPLVLLRTVSTLFLILVLLQPVLAGMFVSGDVDLLALHEVNAHVISFVGWLQVLAAVLVWRPGRGPVWPLGLAVLLSAAVWMQGDWGYARQLDLHIPVGVLLVSAATALVHWSFGRKPGPGTSRGQGSGTGDERGSRAGAGPRRRRRA